MFNKSLFTILAVSTLCLSSARAEDLSYLPTYEDPIALDAVSQCVKLINKNTKKAAKLCTKITKAEDKITSEFQKMQASITKANNYFNNKKDSIKYKYDTKRDKHLLKLADLSILNNNIGDLIDCVGGFFGFGDADCSDQMAKKAAQIAEQIAKETLKMEQDEDKRDLDNQKNEYKKQQSIQKAESKYNAKANDLTSDISGYQSEIDILNDQIAACGGAPVFCS